MEICLNLIIHDLKGRPMRGACRSAPPWRGQEAKGERRGSRAAEGLGLASLARAPGRVDSGGWGTSWSLQVLRVGPAGWPVVPKLVSLQGLMFGLAAWGSGLRPVQYRIHARASEGLNICFPYSSNASRIQCLKVSSNYFVVESLKQVAAMKAHLFSCMYI